MNVQSPRKIRILLVDDHQIVRLGLITLLQHYPQFEVVGDASNASTALQLALETKPDVILMDARLGDDTGFDACAQIHRSGLESRILFLTSYDSDEFVSQAIQAGADGFLLKEIDGEVLVRAIEDVAQGKSILDPSVTRRVFTRLVTKTQTTDHDKLTLLSPQEKRVLAQVAEGKTNKEIAIEMGLSDKTVKNYLSNLMEKLNFSRRTQAAAFYIQESSKK
jgi:two-component system response regulator DevR